MGLFSLPTEREHDGGNTPSSKPSATPAAPIERPANRGPPSSSRNEATEPPPPYTEEDMGKSKPLAEVERGIAANTHDTCSRPAQSQSANKDRPEGRQSIPTLDVAPSSQTNALRSGTKFDPKYAQGEQRKPAAPVNDSAQGGSQDSYARKQEGDDDAQGAKSTL